MFGSQTICPWRDYNITEQQQQQQQETDGLQG